MQNEKNSESEDQLARLTRIMVALRDPKTGCPWDVAQTMSSLTRYTIEEAYEVADAIAKGNPDEICDELGDLLFQVVFYSQIADEDHIFDLQDVARAICEKLIRRHPHVFAGESAPDEAELNAQWEAIKAQEKQRKDSQYRYLLDDVPSGLPALKLAHKMQKRCASVGFDWPDVLPVLAKVREEIDEINAELIATEKDQAAIEEEIGDALFAMVNLARHCKVDADAALRQASHKFARRFNAVETLAKERKQSLSTLSLHEMEKLWLEIKQQQSS
ncbi:nucleoside triphosphate pyrophosphohydrolase [Alteromonas sp. H39]|uniref:nucleoside triphosphate pyrophosphohydrolase n=1 Tax=Alteromonas sp. H39 TaxID=3389876 RepID=UPI0039E12369